MAAAPYIRVLLVDLPLLLCDLIERALVSHGISIVGVAHNASQLAVTMRETDPDYVIVGMEHGGLPAEFGELFSERSRPRVLGVAPGDGSVDLYELRPERSPLGCVSPAELVAALRHNADARS